MTLILIGIFVALALFILGQKFPHLQVYRWLIVIPIILAAVVFSMVKIVPPGHVGILVLFGKIHGSVTEGLHLVNPLVSMELMNVRTQEIFEHAEAPSKEGLNIVLEVSCLYHLKPAEAVQVFRQIGPNYREILVKPQFRSAIRGVTVRHDAKDL
jgi:regulator of protease activity HflC (stomatin/prohibitin superfamily)